MTKTPETPETLTKTEIRDELHNIVREKIEDLTSALNARLDAMDRAADLLHDNLTRSPTEMDKQISHIKEIFDLSLANHVQRIAIELFSAQETVKIALQVQKEMTTVEINKLIKEKNEDK